MSQQTASIILIDSVKCARLISKFYEFDLRDKNFYVIFSSFIVSLKWNVVDVQWILEWHNQHLFARPCVRMQYTCRRWSEESRNLRNGHDHVLIKREQKQKNKTICCWFSQKKVVTKRKTQLDFECNELAARHSHFALQIWKSIVHLFDISVYLVETFVFFFMPLWALDWGIDWLLKEITQKKNAKEEKKWFAAIK